jgi:ABC-2 type transport system ATP-binding protein
MSGDDIVIRGKGLKKVFYDFWGKPKVTAIDGLDIEIRKGTITGLLGPNGAGKSTLMKILLGHLYPTAGTIEVLGKNPRNVKIKELETLINKFIANKLGVDLEFGE